MQSFTKSAALLCSSDHCHRINSAPCKSAIFGGVFNSKPQRTLILKQFSSSSSWMLSQNAQCSSAVLPCKASLKAQETPAPDRNSVSPIHGVSEMVVGVLGGGQLGRMLCQAASEMAIKVIVLDPMKDCPASLLAHHHVVGSYGDSATVEEFGKRCDVLTIEIEHVDAATIEKLEQQGVDCEPKASTIWIIRVFL